YHAERKVQLTQLLAQCIAVHCKQLGRANLVAPCGSQRGSKQGALHLGKNTRMQPRWRQFPLEGIEISVQIMLDCQFKASTLPTAKPRQCTARHWSFQLGPNGCGIDIVLRKKGAK